MGGWSTRGARKELRDIRKSRYVLHDEPDADAKWDDKICRWQPFYWSGRYYGVPISPGPEGWGNLVGKHASNYPKLGRDIRKIVLWSKYHVPSVDFRGKIKNFCAFGEFQNREIGCLCLPWTGLLDSNFVDEVHVELKLSERIIGRKKNTLIIRYPMWCAFIILGA